MSWHLEQSRTIQVAESDGPVDTHMQVRSGDTLIFHSWGSIWAGVWFTGTNGPRGWNWIDHDPKFPLKSSHPFCLYGRLDNGAFYIGDEMRLDETGDQGTLLLEVNDDVHGNGSGAFHCLVQQYRND